MGRGSPFRILLTLLLAAWMPFCCCSLRALAGACNGCEATARRDAEASESLATAACRHCADEPASPSSTDPARPDHKRGHACACGKDTLATFGTEGTPLDLPAPIIAYPLPSAAANAPLLATGAAVAAAWRSPRTADASLLRLHCALIV